MESTHRKCLEKILASKEFCHSKIYQTYLTYLVEASDQGKQLKETTIAIEVFGKDASFNPAEDTIVRSHTYTLRKKLQSYYYSEGKSDKYRLRIPKGHYQAKFITAPGGLNNPQELFGRIGRRSPVLIALGLIIPGLLIPLAALWKQNATLRTSLDSYRIIPENDPVWSDYFTSPKPILIILGNHFFFNDYSEKYNELIAMRHPKINSAQDMETYRELLPDANVEVTNEPYFPYHSIWSLPPILNILYAWHKEPIMRKSSEISPQILDEYNIIFLGSIKTLYKLRHTLLKSHFNYEIAPHKVIYTPPDTEAVQIFETKLHSPGENEDLVLALKLQGPDQNAIFIIASYHSLGAPEIAKYLTHPELRRDLDQRMTARHGHFPEYFEILFRVTGIDKTAYDTEILVANPLTPDDPVSVKEAAGP